MAAKIGNQPSMGVRQVFVFFPAEGATSVSGFDANGATLNYEPFSPPNVYLNGVKLVAGHDYTATTGTSITGIAPMHAGDVVVVEVFGTWSPANAYTKAEADAQFLQKTGGDLTGHLLALDRLVAQQATANGNAHFWLRNIEGKNRGLVYWDRNSGAVSLRVYVDDENGSPIVVGNLVLHANGTMTFNNNTVWDAGHKASVAQFRAGAANTILTSDGVWAAAGYVGLSGASGSTLASGTYAPNFSAGLNFFNVLGGNITIGNPTNAKVGQTGLIVLQQDGTGGRTVAFGSAWKFANGSAPSMNTAVSRVNVVAYQVLHSGFVIGSTIAGLV